jgi:hypothetical protein
MQLENKNLELRGKETEDGVNHRLVFGLSVLEHVIKKTKKRKNS